MRFLFGIGFCHLLRLLVTEHTSSSVHRIGAFHCLGCSLDRTLLQINSASPIILQYNIITHNSHPIHFFSLAKAPCLSSLHSLQLTPSLISPTICRSLILESRKRGERKHRGYPASGAGIGTPHVPRYSKFFSNSLRCACRTPQHRYMSYFLVMLFSLVFI